jgi:predicted O-methyltransferase YrrM
MKCYQQYLDKLLSDSKKRSESRFYPLQLLELYSCAKNIDSGLILEFGVDHGQSTKCFLNAISGNQNVKLISVDVKDCGSVGLDSKQWDFIQQDSRDIESLLDKKPEIKNGIDILYIDSLHTREQVEKELYLYFPYVKQNCMIYFDDIDSNPYMQNKRKDNILAERNNREILRLLEEVFISNYESIDFNIMRGSTGLGIFKKYSSIGDQLNPPEKIHLR